NNRNIYPGQHIDEAELRKSRRITHGRPAEAAKDSDNGDEHARAEPDDKPTVEGLNPGLEKNKQVERSLHVRELPSVRFANRYDEQRPGVLEVGDHDHRDNGRNELEPWIQDHQNLPAA